MGFSVIYRLLLLSLGILTKCEALISNGSLEDAFRHCNHSGMHLPLYPNEVEKALSDNPLNTNDSIWLGIQKRRLPMWLWLDGQPADKDFSKQKWGNMECGAFHLRDRAMEASDCSRKDFGYICERKVNQSCAEIRGPDEQCIKFDNTLFVFGCGANNWFDARSKCCEIGMDLAILNSRSLILQMHTTWFSNKRACMKAWIGLRISDWISKKKQEHIFRSSWAPGQPSGEASCAVIAIDRESQVHMWYAERCEAVHNFLCFHDFDRTTVNATYGVPDKRRNATRRSNDEDYNLVGIKIAAGVIFSLLPLLLVGGVGFWFYRKKSRGKALEKIDKAEAASEENKPLTKDQTAMKKETTLDDIQDSSFVSLTVEENIVRFTQDRGMYEVPKSNIILEIPEGTVEDGLMGEVKVEIEAHMKAKEYKLVDGEKMVSPLVIFNIHNTLLEHIVIHVPHGIQSSSDNLRKNIKTYEWIATNAKFEVIPTVSDSKADIYAVNGTGKVSIYTKRSTQFLCTCEAKLLESTAFSALMIAKYDKDEDNGGCEGNVDHQEEVTFQVFLLDSMYAREECIQTLPDDEMDMFEFIPLLHSSLPPENEYNNVFIRVELDIEKTWEFVKLKEGKDQHYQAKLFSKIIPSDDNPVGQKLAKFIIRKGKGTPKKDILRYKFLITLSDRKAHELDDDKGRKNCAELEGLLDLLKLKQEGRDT